MIIPTATRTFLFTDIEGSTRIWSERSAEMSAALARHDALVGDALRADGGQIFKTMGDAFCAAFGTPVDAVSAALAVQRALAAEDWSAFGPAFPALRVRIAIHTGEAEVRDGDFYGPPVNRVARLLGAGHGGQVLVSGTAASELVDGLRPEVTLLDLGDHRLKDLSRPERIHQLTAPDLERDFPPLRTLERHRTNLPIQATSFVGRERERAEVKRQLAEARLVTLTGAGGSGKTRLALQVAAEMLDDLPDGAWFVDLAPILDPDVVLGALAAVLGLRAQPERPLVETVLEHLKPRELLVVLDNCEHLLGAAAELAEAILRTAPGVRLLATTRERLAVSGEQVWPVPTLGLPAAPAGPMETAEVEALVAHEAVMLFVDRARAANVDFEATEQNIAAIVEICGRLDGLPLAIELAAARVRLLAPEQIRVHLQQRFALLTSGRRTALPRQQTLRGAIDWSYDLLSEAERKVFRRCAMFRGGWDLAAALAVCREEEFDEWAVLDLLSQLVDKSLVVLLDDVAETARYGWLETLAEYARERLAEAGDNENATVRARHLSHYLAVAQEGRPQLDGNEREVWRERLRAELENFRGAFDWASHDPAAAASGVLMAEQLAGFWAGERTAAEAHELISRFTHVEVGPHVAPEQAKLLWFDGLLLLQLVREAEAKSVLGDALERARQVGNERLESWVLHELSTVAMAHEDPATAIACLEASIAIKRRVAPAWDVAIGLNALCVAYENIDPDRSEGLYLQLLEMAAEGEDHVRPATRAAAEAGLFDLALRRGDLPAAATRLASYMNLTRSAAPRKLENAVVRAAWLAAARGRYGTATRLLGAHAASQRRRGVVLADWSAGIADPSVRELHASIVAGCREVLGEDAFRADLADGQELSLEDAVALAEIELAAEPVSAADAFS